MRPVDKGVAPNEYVRYQDASVDLLARLGDYCSYCDRQIETHLAVEHVQPKVRRAKLRNSWTNFLLGCVHCNSSKGKTRVALRDYFWPDTDNTLRAFEHVDGGLVRPHADLLADDQVKARDTIALTALDKFPGNPDREPTASDRRWLRRREAWQIATRSRARLAGQDTVAMREQIVETAVARGMYCVWWTVFDGDVDLRRRFRAAFIGTDVASFDINENTVPRVGGQL